tara:strand:- start:367 stop:564 length:198 start_codon:yes stop_codon:yes gene_type:complete
MPYINHKNNPNDDLKDLLEKFVNGLSNKDFQVLKAHITKDGYGFNHANYDLRMLTNSRREKEEGN